MADIDFKNGSYITTGATVDWGKYLLNDWTLSNSSVAFGLTTDSENLGEEEWIWVTGYKGTDKNMKCRDYQYEMRKQHDMPEDESVKMCSSGFHFCDKLIDVYRYYDLGNGNRFFEVKALVRRWKKDGYYKVEQRDDKMVAKSIIFTRELTIDEIFNSCNTDDEVLSWTTEQKEKALKTSISNVRNSIKVQSLIELGYSEAFAEFVVTKGSYEVAKVMASMPDVSMDVKALTVAMDIFN